MPEALYNKLHACIHKLFTTLRNHPGELSETLKKLNIENVKILLSGASFGGGIAIRHAQLYNNTYDGYISRAGMLSANMLMNSDLEIVAREDKLMRNYLNPSQKDEIKKISSPLLLTHYSNDNNFFAHNYFSSCIIL